MRLRRLLSRLIRATLIAGVLGFGLLYATSEGLSNFGARPEGDRLARMEASPRWSDGQFVNDVPEVLMPASAWMGFLQETWSGGQQRTPPGPLPMAPAPRTYDTPPDTGLRVTWLGHSTLLVEIDGLRVLTDPVWGERPSPSTVVGVKRFHPPPLPLEALPPIDVVVLSHDHYDHLDAPTIRRLAQTEVPFVAPLGVGAHLEAWGVAPERITELDWWEETRLPGGLTLVATPAAHFSGRALVDTKRTLWASWAILGSSHRVWFSGDTGPTEAFAEIGARLGPFDLAMIECGAYNVAWPAVHLGPEGAVEAGLDVRARRVLPVHWSTWQLANHAWDEPAERLTKAAEAAGLPALTPILGQPIEPLTDPATEAWWRGVGD
ncbi:MAG: MBL fold metallo-hydrolase [Alphaproteobacteria bacterium]|nr:MBL fold metallo-hydrolase [Alphaproteobacteria bacterium]